MPREALTDGAVTFRRARALAAACGAALLAACAATPKVEHAATPAQAPVAEIAAAAGEAAGPAPRPTSAPTAAEPAQAAEAAVTRDRPDGADSTVPSAPPAANEVHPAVDRTPAVLRETVVLLARGLDRWFGDKPFDESKGVRDGRLSIFTSKREGSGVDSSVHLNARVRLPNLEERAYLFVGRDNEREGVADQPPAFTTQDRLLGERTEDRSFFAGVGLVLREAVDLRVGFRGIKPYAQARLRRSWVAGEASLVEFRQTFFWRLKDRFGSTTALSFEYAYSPTLALRWLTAATITQASRRYDWSSVAGAHKVLGGDRLLSFELIGTGQQHTGILFTDYGVQTKWLQPVYRDWLLGEFVVGHFWPRPDASSERGQAWAAGFGLIVRF
ncbi:MAG: hypothetical protein OHK0044_19740 [Burkholderiaceae bacterium]